MTITEELRSELNAKIDRASKQSRPHIEINAGELHRIVGGYPPQEGAHHSMPSCCNVMREEMKIGNAEVVHETESGNGASLTIRYHLPRR
jgi:hypothetical protein